MFVTRLSDRSESRPKVEPAVPVYARVVSEIGRKRQGGGRGVVEEVKERGAG